MNQEKGTMIKLFRYASANFHISPFPQVPKPTGSLDSVHSITQPNFFSGFFKKIIVSNVFIDSYISGNFLFGSMI